MSKKLAEFAGNVSKALNQGAERIANGENSKKVEKEVYDEVLTHLQKTYKFGEGARTNRVEEISSRKRPSQKLAASRQIIAAEFESALKHRPKRLLARPNRRQLICCCGGM